MGEAPAGVFTESTVQQAKKEIFDPRTISKVHDQEGRDSLAGSFRQIKKETEEVGIKIKQTESELQTRQENILVKLKQKLNIPDKKTIELQSQLLEARTKQDQLPNPKVMVEAYYEKIAETPLTNQEKRNLLKSEVLSQLSMDEYIALWKRLNPYFLAHAIRQGFRDHNAMSYHSGGLQEFHNGFVEVGNDEKQLRPLFAIEGLKDRDETSVEIFLSSWVLQAENEEEAKKRFEDVLHKTFSGGAPRYPDKTAVHFTTQSVANEYYGGENNNEIFFAFPSDAIASQYDFTFNGWQKDFTHRQSEDKWNDVFVWPKTLQDPKIPVDAGIVFLPKSTSVDPDTGSKYASEIKIIDGKEKRVMVESATLTNSFVEWGKKLDSQSPIKQLFVGYKEERGYYEKQRLRERCLTVYAKELQKLGFSTDVSVVLADGLMVEMYYKESFDDETLQLIIKSSGAHWKRAENTILAKDYWEDFFSKNPNLKPKHVVYYSGDPTNAIYKFQQENGIGAADTSKIDGQLLGFDDHFVSNMETDPRANQGHQELVDLGNKIITEHYASR